MDSAPEMTNLAGGPAIAIRAQISPTELGKFFGGAFGELVAGGADQIEGPPFARYYTFDPQRVDVEVVMPLRSPRPVSGRLQAITLVAGPAVQVRHVGPYESLGEAYRSIEQWIEDHHRRRGEVIREVYMTDPTVLPADRITMVIQPLQADTTPAAA